MAKNVAADCMLSESQRNCAGGPGYREICLRCGWRPEEQERRHRLPLELDADGLRRKHVGEHSNQPE